MGLQVGSSGLASVVLCLAAPLGTKGNCTPGSQRQHFLSGSDGETLSHGRTSPLVRAGIRMRGKQGQAGTGLSGREKDGQVARTWVPFSVEYSSSRRLEQALVGIFFTPGLLHQPLGAGWSGRRVLLLTGRWGA